MTRCYECGASQFEGTLFCTECGLSLLSPKYKDMTDVLPFTYLMHRTSPPLPVEHERVVLEEERPLTFMIPSSRQRVVVSLHEQIQIGRADAEGDFFPELDLTDHNGGKKGVSRHHAAFEASKLGTVLIDLGSTNGTYLNSFRLTEKRPYLIKDGDEIRFGDLLIHIFVG